MKDDRTIAECDAYRDGLAVGGTDWRCAVARLTDDMIRHQNQLTALAIELGNINRRLGALERDGNSERAG